MQDDTTPTPDNTSAVPPSTDPIWQPPVTSVPQPQQPFASSPVESQPQVELKPVDEVASPLAAAPAPEVAEQAPVGLDTTSPVPAFETEVTKPIVPPLSQFSPAPVPGVPDAPTPPIDPSKSGKKKGIIIGAIIAGALVILGGGSAAAYTFWYQNPDKVLGDAFVNALRAKTVSATGEFDYATKDSDASMSFLPSKVKLTVDGKSSNVDGEINAKLAMTYGGQDFKLSGSGMYDKDANLYFKVNDVRKTVDKYNTQGAELPKAYDDIINKVDGKWIKISADDIKEFSEKYADTQKCLKDTLKKLENDKSVTNEIIDLYKKNKFIEVTEKLPAKDNSLGYRIEANEDKSKSFVKGLNDTKLLKELQKCHDSFKVNNDAIDTGSSNDVDTTSTSDNKFEVWVNRWSHQFTELTFSSSDKSYTSTNTVKPVFNKPVSVSVPKDVINLSELRKDFETASQEYASTVSSSISSASEGYYNALLVSSAVESYKADHRGVTPTLQQLVASDSSLTDIVSSGVPTASAPNVVQYELVNGSYSVKYYDVSLKAVKDYSMSSLSDESDSDLSLL